MRGVSYIDKLHAEAATLREERNENVAKLEHMVTALERSGRTEMSPEAAARFDATKAEIDRAGERLDEIEAKITELDAIHAAQTTNTRGAPIPGTGVMDTTHLGGRQRRGTTEARGRALRAVEECERVLPGVARSTYDAIARAVEREDDKVAHAIAVYADPAYFSAFARLLGDPIRGHMTWTPAEREAFARVGEVERAMSLGGTASVAVPLALAPEFVLTGAGSIDPMRQVATVRTTISSPYKAVTAAQINGSWDSEASEVSDDSPTLTAQPITAYLGRTFVAYSFETEGDVPDLAMQLAEVLRDAKANLEATAFAVGSGSQPQGIMTLTGATTASRVAATTTSAFGLADLYAVQAALPNRFSRRAAWAMALPTINRARRFGEGTTGSNSAFWADLGAGTPPTLLGRPVHEVGAVSSTITTGGDILCYADFSRFYIVDHIGGTRVEFIPNMISTSNARPTSERGVLMWHRTGAQWVDVNAARILRLTA